MFAITIGIAVIALVAYSRPSENSPTQNKQIELRAFDTKNPRLCDSIVGDSYEFGPTDAQVKISQNAAQTLCRENIENGIAPVMHGG